MQVHHSYFFAHLSFGSKWFHGQSITYVSCSIDLTAPVKHIGHLSLPKITNTAGWASSFVHIASIGDGNGPTILVLAGNYGDEYERRVAALRLLQDLQPEQVSGRVIVIPVLSTAAAKVNTLLWPSGQNLDCSFTGRPDGSPTVFCEIRSGVQSHLAFISHPDFRNGKL